MRQTANPSALVCVAQVAAAHGVRGAVKLRCFTDAPENVANYGPLLDSDGRELFSVDLAGHTKGGVIATINGVFDRDAAEALRGTQLFIDRDSLPSTDEDEFYHADLIGMTVENKKGHALGEVCAVHDFGAGDIIEYQTASGTQEMVPFTNHNVPTVDLSNRRLVLADVGVEAGAP